MIKYKSFFKLFILLIAFLGCQTKMVKKTVIKIPEIKATPDSAFVTVRMENVRQTPNGRILGKIRKNQKIYIDKRFANWVKFHNEKYDSAYIWAPSIGLDYINLYSPATYFDTTTGQFYPVEYVQDLLGNPGELKTKATGEYQLFFKKVGLGSHEEIVLEVVTQTTEQIDHGIALYIREKDNHIFQVKVDFFRPVKGIEATLKKCNLTIKPCTQADESRAIWEKGILFPGLEITLERKEWQSEWFSSIVFRSSS